MTSTDSPSELSSALARQAESVASALCDQDARWGASGWTRRRFLSGMGMVGVAALGTQLVTTKVAYAAPNTASGNTLITVFLRGAADGLRILVPASDGLGVGYLRSVRSSLVPADADLLSLSGTSGWALNKAMAPLMPFWATGELAFVPAVSAHGISRSHFQAQQYLDRGGSDTASTGWLDRVLQQLGPGTTFRALAEGSALPSSLTGSQSKLVMNSLKNFAFPGWDGVAGASETAIRALYRGMPGPLGEDVPITLGALATAAKARAGAGVHNGAVYPSGNFSSALSDIATLLRAEVGLEVATVDVGGWDTHTDEAGDLDRALTSASKSLAAFLTDLGPARRKRVSIAVVTEFGRRVAMNASGGTDHGHGSVMWLLGGGLARADVFGRWSALSEATVASGDVPGLNSAFAVLGELAQKRLNVGSLSKIFPGQSVAPLGVASVY
ncbi:DUF1501 domain-containing protein [Jatrophihabitans telluris]|uniref:DUF1501 domain-containing protein n=1 Tax=Jatrophihabitans telluris TaxID=2038343 RepID=A0ABY4R1J7_9ACTN|nr:DUF1501 domain-containing protein [Jatrophihabitans telluris]UQX89675.1 DUF1501 domain-containing protein [Jatrophihabitans telluris]